MCAKCKRRVESSKNHTWGHKSLKGMRNRLVKIQTFITHHYIILTSLLYQVRTLTSHDMEESENSPESPHLGKIKRMCKQCVPGAPPFFMHAGDKAMAVNFFPILALYLAAWDPKMWIFHMYTHQFYPTSSVLGIWIHLVPWTIPFYHQPVMSHVVMHLH